MLRCHSQAAARKSPMQTGLYGPLHGDVIELDVQLLSPYVRESHDGGREQGLMVEMYVSL